MKKSILLLAVLSFAQQLLYAQQSDKPTAQQLQAGVKASMARADYTKIFLKDLNVSNTQKPEVNKILQEYMVAKQDLNKLDSAAYVNRQAILFNNMKNSLATVLTKEQLATFMAAKPKITDKPSLLTLIYY